MYDPSAKSVDFIAPLVDTLPPPSLPAEDMVVIVLICAFHFVNQAVWYHGLIYSLLLSPPGLRLPVCGCLIHPSGSPTPSHASKLATASCGVSYHQPSSRDMSSTYVTILARPKVSGMISATLPSGSSFFIDQQEQVKYVFSTCASVKVLPVMMEKCFKTSPLLFASTLAVESSPPYTHGSAASAASLKLFNNVS